MPLKKIKEGDILSAAWLNEVLDASGMFGKVTGSGGISVDRSSNGICIRMKSLPDWIIYCETTEQIAANAKGSVMKKMLAGTDELTYEDRGEETIWNNSSSPLPNETKLFAVREKYSGRWLALVLPGAKFCITAESIPAMSSLTPGSGEAVFYTFNGTSFIEGEAATVYNQADEAIAASTHVVCVQIDGYWFIDWEQC